MMSQQSFLSSGHEAVGEYLPQRLAQNLAGMVRWIELLEQNLSESQSAATGRTDFQPAYDNISQLEEQIALILKVIRARDRADDGVPPAPEEGEGDRPLADRASFAENRLRQKEEEVEQTQSELDRQKEIADTLDAEARDLRKKLKQADKWVFNLAGHRRDLEVAINAHRRDLGRAQALLASEQAKIARFENRTSQQDRMLADQRRDIARLGQWCDELEKQLQAVSQDVSDGAHDIVMEYQSMLALRRSTDEWGLARHRRAQAETEARRLCREVETLTAMLLGRDEAVHAHEMRYTGLMGEITDMLDRLEAVDAERERLIEESQYRARAMQEMAQDLRIVNERQAQADEERERLAAICEILMKARPFWWFLMPTGWRIKQKYKELGRKRLFDPVSYYEIHPDVAEAGLDALDHYIRHGVAERRNCPVAGR